jgi:hypothetical protein
MAFTWAPGASHSHITTGVAELVAVTTMSASATAARAEAAARTGAPSSAARRAERGEPGAVARIGRDLGKAADRLQGQKLRAGLPPGPDEPDARSVGARHRLCGDRARGAGADLSEQVRLHDGEQSLLGRIEQRVIARRAVGLERIAPAVAAAARHHVEPPRAEREPRARNVDGFAARLRQKGGAHGLDDGRHVQKGGGVLLIEVDRHWHLRAEPKINHLP